MPSKSPFYELGKPVPTLAYLNRQPSFAATGNSRQKSALEKVKQGTDGCTGAFVSSTGTSSATTTRTRYRRRRRRGGKHNHVVPGATGRLQRRERRRNCGKGRCLWLARRKATRETTATEVMEALDHRTGKPTRPRNLRQRRGLTIRAARQAAAAGSGGFERSNTGETHR
jgi:hypothetical protein